MLTDPDIPGMVARFFNRISLDPTGARSFPLAGLIYSVQQHPRSDDTKGVPGCPP